MREERLLMAMTEIDARLIQAHVPTAAEKSAAPRRRRPLRAALVAAAVAALLVTAAMALSPAFRDRILTSLGFRAPYATEAPASCEDQGITITAQEALADGRVTRLYLTVHDPSGVFFLADTDYHLYLDFLNGEEEVFGSGGEGLTQLSYDPESQTGLYMYSQGTYIADISDPAALTHAKLTMDHLLPGSREWSKRFYGPALSDDPDLPIDTLETAVENGATVLLPGQTSHTLDEDCPEVYISSMGFDKEGKYHIRLHADPGIVSTYSDDPSDVPFYVRYDTFASEESQREASKNAIAVKVSDGWDYCLPDLTRESYPRLAMLNVNARYSVSGGYRQGNWALTVPIEQVEARTAKPADTLILSRTKDSPPPSGRNDEAQVSQVHVSPLSVVVDFVTPEGHIYPGHISGEETDCVVLLSDGSAVGGIYYSQTWHNRVGWVMWEFDAPIEPGRVVSVALNGREVAFPAG